MSIKALVYGGIQITGILHPTCRSQYDGVWIEMVGTTLKDNLWQRAGMTIEMSQKDALDMALALFLAAEKHGDDAEKAPALLVKRLAKRMAKKEKQ